MGQILARIWDWFFGKKERRILMLGLGGSGKTTILYKLKLGETVHTIPTIGFNVETVEYKGFKLVMWDVGGQDKIRSLWVHYFANTHLIIFVIDSNDREKLEEAKQEIQKLLSEEELKNVGLLFLANKQDLPNALTVAELVEKLQLYDINTRQWFLQATCAMTGDGLYEGLDWLTKTLKN